MPLPEMNARGDLPAGVYRAHLDEVIARFGSGSAQRVAVTNRLRRIHELVIETGSLDRLIVFGSYISDKVSPNDIDAILVMQDQFRPSQCPPEALVLFDHARATSELGASISWIRPGMLIGEQLDQFIAHWRVKRDGSKRGIVEVYV